MRQEMEKTVLKGRHGGWSIWLSVAFGMVWLLLLPGQSVARVPDVYKRQGEGIAFPKTSVCPIQTGAGGERSGTGCGGGYP